MQYTHYPQKKPKRRQLFLRSILTQSHPNPSIDAALSMWCDKHINYYYYHYENENYSISRIGTRSFAICKFFHPCSGRIQFRIETRSPLIADISIVWAFKFNRTFWNFWRRRSSNKKKKHKHQSQNLYNINDYDCTSMYVVRIYNNSDNKNNPPDAIWQMRMRTTQTIGYFDSLVHKMSAILAYWPSLAIVSCYTSDI